ncbi:MAG: DUF4373 domain-containing protein [Prevotella pallens]|uniref:DUF4373 domain-containing protein n=1 Tax=Prevotella pallens TaxID=60133 RepID=UPI001CB6174C|nr:DUF4373 domain-containing protein [Prevotella pallens]MBF1490673.1 DUF4373 domain-containing protein [Prevotella pallens]
MNIDYYPIEISIFQDAKVQKLIQYQGAKAATVYVYLLCEIYRNGYYISWNKTTVQLVMQALNLDVAFVKEVVICCAKVGLFNSEYLYKEEILTSKGIQKRYLRISKLCNNSITIEDYSCIENKQSVKQNNNTTGIDKEIEELKLSCVWLDNLQTLHHLPKDVLINKLDDFKLQCLADGIEEHANIRDAKQHFNNWLRKMQNNESNRQETKNRRRGNVLTSSKKKEYTDTF